MNRSANDRLLLIDVLVLDVDGVLTDGRVIYSDTGAELQAFHVRDGSGLAMWRSAGKQAAIISGRGSRALERRAAELGISPVIMHADDKAKALGSIVERLKVEANQVAAIADDLPDLAVMRRSGVTFAVADASPEVRSVADFVTQAAGGRGAVREAIELILKAQDRWDNVVAHYR
jgi:3-deoxy-D-manno-octulosonate 8-phosphate phosphatase (KDO 8-P phosphatase)